MNAQWSFRDPKMRLEFPHIAVRFSERFGLKPYINRALARCLKATAIYPETEPRLIRHIRPAVGALDGSLQDPLPHDGYVGAVDAAVTAIAVDIGDLEIARRQRTGRQPGGAEYEPSKLDQIVNAESGVRPTADIALDEPAGETGAGRDCSFVAIDRRNNGRTCNRTVAGGGDQSKEEGFVLLQERFARDRDRYLNDGLPRGEGGDTSGGGEILGSECRTVTGFIGDAALPDQVSGADERENEPGRTEITLGTLRPRRQDRDRGRNWCGTCRPRTARKKTHRKKKKQTGKNWDTHHIKPPSEKLENSDGEYWDTFARDYIRI